MNKENISRITISRALAKEIGFAVSFHWPWYWHRFVMHFLMENRFHFHPVVQIEMDVCDGFCYSIGLIILLVFSRSIVVADIGSRLLPQGYSLFISPARTFYCFLMRVTR